MPFVLLATCADLPAGDEDGDDLLRALAGLSVGARWADWADPDIDWSRGLVVVRSTWDYTRRREEFVRWAAAVPRLVNPADVVAWNTDKTYLADLASAGVPVVASAFAAPGYEVSWPDAAEVVVKPTVGAGSRGVGRFGPERRAAAAEHAAALQADGQTVLVQPYLDAVETTGETALVYFEGRFSHAIRKAPMLPTATTHAVDARELYVEERITRRDPTPDELEVGQAALAFVRDRFGADQLYSRVDLLPTTDGPVIVELELTEPSLFLGFGPAVADVFASAIAARA